MAAGYGSRISRQVNKPKSVLDVGNNTIIGHTIEMLLKRNMKVAVVVGYQGEKIVEALKGFDVEYYYNPFFRVTNSLGSLWMAYDFLEKEDTILANADVYWDENCLKILLSSSEPIVVLGDETRCIEGDYFYTVKNGYVQNYGKDIPEKKRTCEYVGVAKIQKEFVPTFKCRLKRMIKNEAYNLWWENVLYEYSQENPIRVLDVSGNFWGEVDWIEDYQRICNYLKMKVD